jgi:hypothetical protein
MIRLSTHAKARAAERRITVAQIRAVVDDPHVTFTDRKGNPCYTREMDGRRIKVVISAADAEFVITVIDLDD